MNFIEGVIQGIVNNPYSYFQPADTSIIGLQGILTQLFQGLGIQNVQQLNQYTNARGGLIPLVRHAISHPLDYTQNPIQEWVDAANGIRGPPVAPPAPFVPPQPPAQQPAPQQGPRRAASAYYKKYSAEDDGELACGICFGTYDLEDPACMVRNCGHVFHCRCIDSWINSGNANRNKCPTCKRDIVSIETVSPEDLRVEELTNYKEAANFSFGRGRSSVQADIRYLRML
jgi:hypothetical protein